MRWFLLTLLVCLSFCSFSVAQAKWMLFEVSAYTICVEECGPQAGWCALTGQKAEIGRTIAVDTKVISPNTRIYIQDIGWRIAEDTGSAIKGKQIDLLVETKEQAFRLGRRKIWCYIEDRPK